MADAGESGAAAPNGPQNGRRSGWRGVRNGQPEGLLLGWQRRPRSALFRQREEAGEAQGSETPLLYTGDSHLLTIAPTGSGKGRGAIIPNLLRYPGPVIVIDPKGENYHVTARYRRSLGQKVHVLDPFGMVTDHTDSLNPMDVFKLRAAEVDSESEMLAELLGGGMHSLKDPFWDISANGLISGLIAYIATESAERDQHLGSLRNLLWGDVVYTIARMLDADRAVGDAILDAEREARARAQRAAQAAEEQANAGGEADASDMWDEGEDEDIRDPGPSLEDLRAERLHPFVRAELEGFLSISADITRGGIIATAFTHAHILKSDAVLRSLAPSSIDIDAVIRGEPMTIYLIIPPTKLESHRGLLRLWIGTLLLALMQRKQRPPLSTLFLLDECAQLGSLAVLRQAVTLMRGYGLQIWMYFQDLSQIKGLYPEDWPTMVNNSAVLQTFGLNTHLVAREMADLIGGITSEELRAIPTDQQVTVMPRDGTRLTRRPDYLNDPLFAGRFDANPLFAGQTRDPLK